MIIVLKKRSLAITAIGIAIIIAIIACIFHRVPEIQPVAVEKKLPVYCVSIEDKKIALTFDAAWGADKTQGILDILAEYDAKATFFLVGFWIEKYPNMVKAICDAGMDIGNHSNNHLESTKLPQQQLTDEISSVNDMLESLTGVKPYFFRPPFGDYNNNVIQTVQDMGMQAIQWDVDSLDWKGLSGAQICERVLARVKSGSIVLFHNNSDYILAALPLILSALTNEGYTFCTLTELVLRDNFTIDHTGMQVPLDNHKTNNNGG